MQCLRCFWKRLTATVCIRKLKAWLKLRECIGNSNDILTQRLRQCGGSATGARTGIKVITSCTTAPAALAYRVGMSSRWAPGSQGSACNSCSPGMKCWSEPGKPGTTMRVAAAPHPARAAPDAPRTQGAAGAAGALVAEGGCRALVAPETFGSVAPAVLPGAGHARGTRRGQRTRCGREQCECDDAAAKGRQGAGSACDGVQKTGRRTAGRHATRSISGPAHGPP